AIVALLIAGITASTWLAVVANQAKIRATIARDHEARASEQLAENLYASSVYLAEHAVLEGDYGLARARLQSLEPREGGQDLRGFEWRYFWQRCKGDSIFS